MLNRVNYSPVSTEGSPTKLSEESLPYIITEEKMPSKTRKWEVFPGRNTFYCDGRIRNDISHWITNNIDLTPLGIIKKFDLFQLNLAETTNYGHFGKEYLPWEKTDIAKELNF